MALTHTKIVPVHDFFALDVERCSGLTIRVNGGVLITGTGFQTITNRDLTLTASSTNYVEVSDAGVISSNTSAFTDGATFLYEIAMGAALITGIKDRRFTPSTDPTLPLTTLSSKSVILKTDAAVVTLLAASTVTRQVIIVVKVDEAYTTGTGTQPTVKIGETGSDAAAAATAVLTNAAAGAVFICPFANTAAKAIIATSTAAVGNATGGMTITVHALP